MLKTADTANSACSAAPPAGPGGHVWPPVWLRPAATAAECPELLALRIGGPLPDLELPPASPAIVPTHKAARCARCGCPGYIDVPIHDGQSIRRDCALCGRLIDFPLWYGEADGLPV